MDRKSHQERQAGCQDWLETCKLSIFLIITAGIRFQFSDYQEFFFFKILNCFSWIKINLYGFCKWFIMMEMVWFGRASIEQSVYIEILLYFLGPCCNGNTGCVTLSTSYWENQGLGIQITDACHEYWKETGSQNRRCEFQVFPHRKQRLLLQGQ